MKVKITMGHSGNVDEYVYYPLPTNSWVFIGLSVAYNA